MQHDSFYHNVAGCLRMFTHSGPGTNLSTLEHRHGSLPRARSAGGVEGTVPRHAWTVPKQRKGLLGVIFDPRAQIEAKTAGRGKMLKQEAGKMVFVAISKVWKRKRRQCFFFFFAGGFQISYRVSNSMFFPLFFHFFPLTRIIQPGLLVD